MAVFGLTSDLFCLFLFSAAVTASANSTSYDFNTTFGDQDVTNNVTDTYTTAQPAEFDWPTTTPIHGGTEEAGVRPTQPDAPLPVSGRLLVPVTNVGSLCPCDEHEDVCDVDCCCDRACSEEAALFTSCSVDAISGPKQLCSRDVASFSLRSSMDGRSELQTSVTKEKNYHVFCIQTQNRVDGLSHPPPTLPTNSNFDSLFKQSSSFALGSEAGGAEVRASSGYQFGDVMEVAEQSGRRRSFWLPAAGVTADCVDTSPAAFLKDQSSRCSRRVVLDQDCGALQALHMDTYTDLQLFTGKSKGAAEVPVDLVPEDLVPEDLVPEELVPVEEVPVEEVPEEEVPVGLVPEDLVPVEEVPVEEVSEEEVPVDLVPVELVPVELSSVVLQAVDGTQMELELSGGENLNPVLLNPSLCANVVLKVAYVVKYNPAGEVVNVTASLVLGFVRGAALTLEQEFSITFVQEDVEQVPLSYGGNPGYVVGRPLMSGTRTAEGITRSVDPRDALTLLHSAEDQDCLRGPRRRSPIQFGLDSVSGCTLRLEDAANCSLVSQVLLDLLRGPNQDKYVASFGNSPLDNPLDWVAIETSYSPGEAQSCSIPLSLHLEIRWTKYGSLVNPQAQVVSVKEVIQTNTTSLDLLSGGSSFLSVQSSVAFVPVSAAALPGYRATPTIDAKLPFDFFFPFV